MTDTPAHEQVERLRVDVEYPEHLERATASTAEFDANRHRLIHRLGLGCWKCGAKEHLGVHHYLIEWSEWACADPAKVLSLMHKFDAYGFAADGVKHGNPVPATPDDLRNLMVLCESCHRGACLGIHQVPLPFWFADLVRKDGATVLKAPAK